MNALDVLKNTSSRAATLALTAAVLATQLAGCAESQPDEPTPAQVDPVDQGGNESAQTQAGNTDGDPGNTKTDPSKAVREPVKHKPEVDPREGQVDDGTDVDLRPKDDPKDPVEPVEPDPPVVVVPPEEPKPLEGEVGGGTSVDLTPAVEAPSRARKRMNIDQLNAALRRVSGGIGWTTGAGWTGTSAGNDNFAALSLTLGKPNYTDLTAEDLDPSALFQKFLGDAASSVCLKLITRDKAEQLAQKRILMRWVQPSDTVASNPGGVDTNLAALLLRFHGHKIAPQSDKLAQWRFLFSSATKISKSPTMAWRTVCVALLQHPRFYTY